jgi:hypothetical protein
MGSRVKVTFSWQRMPAAMICAVLKNRDPRHQVASRATRAIGLIERDPLRAGQDYLSPGLFSGPGAGLGAGIGGGAGRACSI